MEMHHRCVLYNRYMWCKITILQNYTIIHNSQFIISISCISSYMFQLVYELAGSQLTCMTYT